MDKKTPDPKAKAGVKFTDQKREVTPDATQIIKEKLEEKPKVVLDPEACKSTVIKIYNDADTNFKLSAKNDPDVKRKDTARALCKILDTLKEALAHLSSQNTDTKEKFYYLTYNGTIYTYEICRALRKSVYSSLAIQYIANAILALEKNMILRSEKYLDWRVKLYIELAHTYEDCESYKASAKTIETAIGKVEKIKAYHDADPPVPEHINVIVTNNLRILKALDIKYKLHTGVITTGDAWKKKIEEYFKNDVDGRNIVIIESLNPNYKKHSNIVGHVGKTLTFFPWKEQIVNTSFDMIKNDTELLAKALDQLNEKMKMTIAIKEDMTLTEEGRFNLVQKVREFDNTMILEREWKKASYNVPIELHIEVIKHAYDVGNAKVYSELLQTALVRCNFRRIEVPYISDIDIQFSTIPNSNIPNGYEKIAIDINDSHLKSELAKLRLSVAKEIARQQEEKRQEKIKEQQMNKKAGKKPEPIEDGPKPPHPNSIQVDPLSVAHNYIYFLIKRSYSPERAIYAIDIVLADPEKGPVDKIADGWVVKAIKIDQYTGVKETSGYIPWLCLKHSEESLKNEDEKKSLLIDFAPQLAKSYLARPPFGFEKINLDLRQIPREFYKLQNMDYVYVNYKMDRMYYICERELYILKALDELEKSYKGSKVTSDDEELKSHLDVNFDMEKFKELAKYTKKALDGPLGDYFFDARKDFLIKYGFYIWKKYLMSSLHQIDTLYELRLTEELSPEDFKKYEGILYNAKLAYAEMLEAISKILMKTDAIDPIWLIKINVELCKLLEEFGEFRKASQICRFAYNKLIEFKDRWFNRGVESKRDVFLPMTITCNNIEIHKMIEEMKARYTDWKTWLRKEVRAQNRQTNSKKSLEDDEATEEDYEFIEASRVFFGVDSLKDHKNLDTITNEKAFTEYIATINALHTDVVANLLRLEIKAGKQSHKASKMKQTDKFVTTLKNSEGIESIPERLKARLNIMSGATTIQIKKNVNNLQTTLQNAGKLEPPKPKVSKYEELLIEEGASNSYFNALLYMTMAGNKSKLPEQKYLLNESLKFIKQAEEEERTHIQNGIENAHFIFSTLLDDRNEEIQADDFYPFNYLYKPEFIKETHTPPKPILISRSTTTITLKIPPFNPIIPELYLLENPALKIVNLMAIYGKVSQNGVDVSLTSTDLQNTGVRVNNGAIVTVTNLTVNDKYCFAAAGFNPQEKVINGIGKTSEDIACVLPLPINLLYAYLAQNAYQIGYFELAEEASELSGAFFCEKTNIKERSLDYADNPIYLYRIKSEAVKNFSLTELRTAAMNYIVHARCLKRSFEETEKNSRNPILYLTKQKYALNVCNYLMLALECAALTKSYPLAKRIIKEIYNDVIPFLSFRTKSKFIFQILIKAQLLISQIPKEIWDGALRTASIKITYELLKMTLQFNEIRISKLLLYYDSRLPHRKWFIVSKTIMVEENLVIESKDPKDKKPIGKDSKKPAPSAAGSKPQATTSQTEAQVTTKLVPKIVREIMNKATYQDNLEEFLLSLGEEYFDSVMGFIDFWKEQLEYFRPFIDNGAEIIDKKRAELSFKFDFWDALRDQAQAFNKVKNYASSPFYMEFICKYFKKYMEKGFDLKTLNEQFKQVTETNSECIQLVNKIRDLKLKAIEGDIGWNPNMLDELINEREINKQGEDLAIDIYTEFWKLDQELKDKAPGDLQYLYDLKWLGEYNLIKATALYILLLRDLKTEPENRYECFFDVTEVEPERIFQPIEVQNMDNPQQTKINKARIDQLIQLYKYLANAATYFARAKTFNLLQNLAKFSLNIMKVEMLTPYDHQGTELYKYMALMCENLNEMLEVIKITRESDKKSTRLNTNNIPTTPSINIEEHKAGEMPRNTKNYLLDTYLTKDFWFIGQEIDVQSVANNVSYCIKTLSVESKWRVIVEQSKHFCNVTVQYYSIYILPFTEHAQKMLYEAAKAKTNKKREELELRRKAYEAWKAKQKRKKRADQMTGNVPQEQLDFERDELELNKQIEIHKKVEDFLDNDRSRSVDLLKTIKRDENQALENLNQWRKLLVKYGNDRKEFNTDYKKITDPMELKLKEKALDMLYRTVIPKYKEVIEILKKKQENFALVQALHERGNVYFSVGEYKKFMQDWNESLDTIFQSFNSLKNFREQFDTIQKKTPLAWHIGVPGCLIGSILLHKLGQYGYYAEIYNQMECSFMAYELVFAIFGITMPHHLVAISYGAYRVKELLQDQDLFTNKFVLNPADLIVACNYHANFLMDNGHYIKALPFLALMEYLAIDITQSFYYSMKAKLLKVICLANTGYINEAYQILAVAAQEKDLPMGFVKASEYAKKDAGYNFSPAIAPYFNDFPPYDEKNKDVVEAILNMQVNPKFKFKYGFINLNLFNYAKASLIYSVYETENYDRMDDNRMIRLNRGQEVLRNVLKRLAFEDEFLYLKEKAARIERDGVPAVEGGDSKTLQNMQLGYLKVAMMSWMDANDIEDSEKEDHLNHRENGIPYPEVREERITMIMRVRHLLSLMNLATNFTTKAYHIVKFAIFNLSKMAEDQRRIETGDEPGVVVEEVKNDDPKKKPGDKKKEEEKKEKKDDKKDDKKKKDPKKGEKVEEELPAKSEEELVKEFEEDQKLLKKESNSSKTRTSINGFWWLKLRTQFAYILYKQNKYTDCLELIRLFKSDSKNLKDTYFIRILEEIEAKVLIKTGLNQDGLRKLRHLIQIGNSYSQHDIAYGNMVGDFADVLFEKGDIDEAEQNYKLSRDIFNNLLFEIRFESKPQNTNQMALNEELKIAASLQIPLETESLIMRTDKFKMKKDDKKGQKDEKKKVDPKAKGKGGVEAESAPEYEIPPLDPLAPYDYSKENKIILPLVEENMASNKLPFIYTIKYYEAYIKSTLNYVRCLLWKNDDWDQDTIFKMLDDISFIIQNLFSAPISMKFQLHLFYGKALKRKFILEFNKIHKVYLKKLFEEKNKKYRKLSQKVPHRDLLRNQYMIEIPNFSEELKNNLCHILEQARESLAKATDLLKNECLFFECGIKCEEAFIELSQVCIYLREYRPRISYKYQTSEDLKEFHKGKPLEQTKDFDKHVDESIKTDQKVAYELEWHAFSFLGLAIQVAEMKNTLEEKFSLLFSAPPLTEQTKVPQDILQAILESDFQQKKTYGNPYNVKLFDEAKKKKDVNFIDLVLYLTRLARESNILTFSNANNQRLISKLHRYLKAAHQAYQKNMLMLTGAPPRTDTKTFSLSEGVIIAKVFNNPRQKEHRLMYMLGPLNKTQVKHTLTADEFGKIVLNEETDVLYGTLYFSHAEISEFQQKCYDLKSAMEISEKASKDVRDRDYKYHRDTFALLIAQYATKFHEKDELAMASTSGNQSPSSSSSSMLKDDEDPLAILGKYVSFIPDLNMDNINVMINLFGNIGLNVTNHNYLVLMRYFHKLKYK